MDHSRLSSSASRSLQSPPTGDSARRALADWNCPAADEKAREAFQTELVAIVPSLRAFAMSLVGDLVKADDLVQDTIMRALQKRHAFSPGTNLQAWAFTMMRNLFYSAYRSRRREVEDVDGSYAAKLSTLPEQLGSVQFAELRSALATLPDEQREAVLLIGAAGLSYEEAARVCRTKVGTIKSRVNRARTRLSELLGYEDVKDIGPDGLVRAALVSP